MRFKNLKEAGARCGVGGGNLPARGLQPPPPPLPPPRHLHRPLPVNHAQRSERRFCISEYVCVLILTMYLDEICSKYEDTTYSKCADTYVSSYLLHIYLRLATLREEIHLSTAPNLYPACLQQLPHSQPRLPPLLHSGCLKKAFSNM